VLLSFILFLLCGVSVRSSLHDEAPYVVPGQVSRWLGDASSLVQALKKFHGILSIFRREPFIEPGASANQSASMTKPTSQ
jgi:hypothetical protein